MLPFPSLLSIWTILLPLCGFNHKLTKSILYHSHLHPNIHIMSISSLISIKQYSAFAFFPACTFLLIKGLLELAYSSCWKIFNLLHIRSCYVESVFLFEGKLVIFWIRGFWLTFRGRYLLLFCLFLLCKVNLILMRIKATILWRCSIIRL